MPRYTFPTAQELAAYAIRHRRVSPFPICPAPSAAPVLTPRTGSTTGRDALRAKALAAREADRRRWS